MLQIPSRQYCKKYRGIRRAGEAKLKEMGSRYFFIIMYVWLEKYFSRGDYRRQMHLKK